MDPKESVKQKLERYQRTQELTNQIRFDQEAKPYSKTVQESPSANIQSTSSRIIQAQSAIERNDMEFVRSYIKTLSELDPANPYYTNLLKRDFISWDEFQEIVHNFSANHSYLVKMQYEINNLRLAETREAEIETEEPESLTDQAVADQPQQQEEEQQGQEPRGQEESSDGQRQQSTKREPPRRVISQRPKPNKELTEEEDIERRKQKRQRKQERREGRKERRKANREARRAQQKFNSSRLGQGLNRANNILNAPNRLSNRLGERFGNSRLGQGLSRINNFLGAPGRFLSRLGNRFASRFLNNRFGRVLGRIGRGFNALDRFLNPIEHFMDKMLEKLASKLGRLAWEGTKLAARLAMQAARALANLASQVLSRLGSQALTAAGRGLAAGAAAIGVSGFIIIAVTILALFTIWWLYDSNSECGKPGTITATKGSDKEQYTEGQNIQFHIIITYAVKCPHAYADVDVRDPIPANTSFVEGSAKTAVARLFSGGPLIGSQSFYLPGPDGVLDGNTLTWRITNLAPNKPTILIFSVTPNQTDIWLANQATIGYRTYTTGLFGIGSSSTGGKILDPSSLSLEPTFVAAARNVGMPPELLKAIAKTEAPKVFDYNEEEFQRFSIPGWWEGLTANASTLAGNDPNIIRGYAYNTCAYRNDCAAGADVRGVTQFELGTWNGIAGDIQFSDGHQPDRRNATDAIYGSAILNRKNAESYTGSSNIEWTEDVVRAVARMYCGGPAAGKNPSRARVSACGWNGSMGYDDFVWRDYKIFTGQP